MSAEAVRQVRVTGRGLRLLGDERLAVMAGRGSSAAFEVLYMRHHQAVYRYCRSIVRSEEEARDALQSTMLRAFAALRSGRVVAFRPWLFGIAHNVSISLVHDRGKTEALPEAEHLPALALSVEGAVDVRERFSLLSADLQELPERQRAALVMRELSGLSHVEIGAALGVSTGAAKQAIFEARAALFEFAAGREASCEAIRRTLSDGDGRMLRGRAMRGHLRSCAGCRAFRAALAERPAKLAALAPPLAPVAALPLLAHLSRGGAVSHSAATPLAGTAGGKAIASSLLAKAAVGAALAATATVAVVHTATTPHARVSAPRVHVAAVTKARGASPSTDQGAQRLAQAAIASHAHSTRGQHTQPSSRLARVSAPPAGPTTQFGSASPLASSASSADSAQNAAAPSSASGVPNDAASSAPDGNAGPSAPDESSGTPALSDPGSGSGNATTDQSAAASSPPDSSGAPAASDSGAAATPPAASSDAGAPSDTPTTP